MKNPFHTLGIPEESDEGTILEAYQRRLKSVSRLRGPERTRRLREIENAFDAIGDARERVRSRLFNAWEPDVNQLLGPILRSEPATPPSSEQVLELMIHALEAATLPSPTTTDAKTDNK